VTGPRRWSATVGHVIVPATHGHSRSTTANCTSSTGPRGLLAADMRPDGSLGTPAIVVREICSDAGQHANRTIAFGGPNGMVCGISVGSTCNACNETNPEEPRRCCARVPTAKIGASSGPQPGPAQHDRVRLASGDGKSCVGLRQWHRFPGATKVQPRGAQSHRAPRRRLWLAAHLSGEGGVNPQKALPPGGHHQGAMARP